MAVAAVFEIHIEMNITDKPTAASSVLPERAAQRAVTITAQSADRARAGSSPGR